MEAHTRCAQTYHSALRLGSGRSDELRSTHVAFTSQCVNLPKQIRGKRMLMDGPISGQPGPRSLRPLVENRRPRPRCSSMSSIQSRASCSERNS